MTGSAALSSKPPSLSYVLTSFPSGPHVVLCFLVECMMMESDSSQEMHVINFVISVIAADVFGYQ